MIINKKRFLEMIMNEERFSQAGRGQKDCRKEKEILTDDPKRFTQLKIGACK